MSRIDDEKLQNVYEKCSKCYVMKQALSDNDNDTIQIGDARRSCMHCKNLNQGIYKFDAIYTAISSKNAPNQGKKETYTKRYGKAVETLKNEGKSIRKIAEILGISPTSVQKILKS